MRTYVGWLVSLVFCTHGVHGQQPVPWCEPGGSTQYFDWLDGTTAIVHNGVPNLHPQCAIVDNSGIVTVAPGGFIVTANPGETKISTFQIDFSLLFGPVIINSGTVASHIEATVPDGGVVSFQLGMTLNGTPDVTCGTWSQVTQMVGPNAGILSRVISCGFEQAQVSHLAGHVILTVQGPPTGTLPTIAQLQRSQSQVSIDVPIASCPSDVAPVWPASPDGVVDADDLLTVISSWHDCPINLNPGLPGCPPCVGDINRDCDADVRDLLAVIGHWGSCK